MVTDALSGAYHSVFKGQGMDFEEVREYAPGDDIRAIDWNVTAKMDRPFVKKFREERELTMMLLVDLSASGSFGSDEQSKRELATELASVLAFSATRNNDKVGLMLFTDHVEKFIFPQKGRQHILRVIRETLFYQPQNSETNLVQALAYMNRVLKRKAVVFLISDFLQGPDNQLPHEDNIYSQELFKALSLTNKRHDLTCIQLSDPREMELPDVGIITLEDAETGELIEVNTSNSRFRELYTHENSTRQDKIQRSLRQAGVGNLTIETNKPYIHTLRQFLERRSKRR